MIQVVVRKTQPFTKHGPGGSKEDPAVYNA